MAVFIEVKSRFDDTSGRKAAEDAKKYFANAGTNSGQEFSGNFAKAVERDNKVRAAAEKVADQLDKITVAEAKRATQLEKSKAINQAVADSEAKLAQQRSLNLDASAAETEKQLTELRAKQVDINNRLIVSSTSVTRAERDKARAIREAGDAYRKMGDDAESAMSKIGKLSNLPGGGGLFGLQAGLTGIGLLPAAATAITEVAGALNQLAGAGFAIPGIFAGIASSVGVGALSMHGMSDAIKAVDKASDGTKASVEAANKALAELSPTGADVVKTVVGLKGTFTDLRNIGSENMFAGVSGGLKGLVAADLPAVTRGVDGISRALNQNLRQAITSLGSGSSQGFLDRIFGNTAGAQSNLTAAIDPIVHAVGALSATGSDALPRLADDITSIATRFDQFITSADADGRLKKWIDDGISGFESLGRTALSLGTSFEKIVAAAGGGAGLIGTLESASAKLATFTSSAEGQQKLANFFAQGRDTLAQLKDVATTAGPVLAGVFQAGLSAANLWLPVIKEGLEIINKIPGGAQAVVTAFGLWKGITAVGTLTKSLESIATLLKLTLPAAAAEGATGITAALAGITAPAWLAGLIGAGGAAIAPAVGDRVSEGANIPRSRVPLLNRDGTVNTRGTTDPKQGLGGGGGSFGGAPITVGPLGGGPGAQAERRGNTTLAPADSVTIPGVSSYSAPTITDGSGSGAAATPFIDPSKYMMGDPLAGMPGAVAGADPSAIFDADSKLITATHNMEQKKLALQVLEAQGNATQQQLLTAKNDLEEQERALYDAQADDIKARTNQMKQATSDLQGVFAPLDQDFGVSGGIPGIVKNLTTLFGNLALGSAIGSSPTLSAAYASMVAPSGGSSSAAAAPSAYGLPGVATGGGYPGDAALLANVPSGRYSQTSSADLTRGLGDCSSAVEDLVNLLQGEPTGGRSMSTGNAAEWLTSRGFQPGSMPGALNVGYSPSHMQATLPGGTPFNWGSDAAAARGGVGGTGAFDPSFTDHYYLPVGASPSAIGPAPLGGGVGANPLGGPGLGGAGPTGFNTGVQPMGSPGGGGGGGPGPGGLADTLGGAADMIAPGSSVAIKLASRAIQYGSQVAAIGASGIMETVLPAGSPLAANSWFSKLAGGLSGAKPAGKNQAGQPTGGAPAQGAPPMGSPASGQGMGPPPGPTFNTTVNNNRATEDGTGRDLTSHLGAMYSGVSR